MDRTSIKDGNNRICTTAMTWAPEGKHKEEDQRWHGDGLKKERERVDS